MPRKVSSPQRRFASGLLIAACLIAACLITEAWFTFGHANLASAQPPATDNRDPEAAVQQEKQPAESKSQIKPPVVDWNVEWEVTRSRPGYPLLANTEHFQVHAASLASGAYHHHPQITFFQNRFFACWSNHPFGEDGPGQQVIGATSLDGKSWMKANIIFEHCDHVKVSTGNGRLLTASNFIQVEDRLFAVATVNDSVGFGTARTPILGQPLSKTKTVEFFKRIRIAHGFLVRELFANGNLGPVFWLGSEKPTPVAGFPEFVPPSTLTPAVMQQLKKQLADPLTRPTWDFDSPNAEPTAADGSLLIEPTTQMGDDDLMIRYYRDMNGSRELYVRFSRDNGMTWTEGQQTNIPDAPSKSVLGRLPDGQFFLIGNQVVSVRGTRRDPLTIGLSHDGTTFEKAFAIRWRAPKFQVARQQVEPDGRGRGFQYPSYVVANNALWVIYSVNKEAIDVSRLDLDELQ